MQDLVAVFKSTQGCPVALSFPSLCREEYLAESAARLAVSAGELADVEQHAQRAKAPLVQAAAGEAQAKGAPRAGGAAALGSAAAADHAEELLWWGATTCCLEAPHRLPRAAASGLSLLHLPTLPSPAELLEGWYMRAVALFAAHGRDHHTPRELVWHAHVACRSGQPGRTHARTRVPARPPPALQARWQTASKSS